MQTTISVIKIRLTLIKYPLVQSILLNHPSSMWNFLATQEFLIVDIQLSHIHHHQFILCGSPTTNFCSSVSSTIFAWCVATHRWVRCHWCTGCNWQQSSDVTGSNVNEMLGLDDACDDSP